jgi:hypothetical protein
MSKKAKDPWMQGSPGRTLYDTFIHCLSSIVCACCRQLFLTCDCLQQSVRCLFAFTSCDIKRKPLAFWGQMRPFGSFFLGNFLRMTSAVCVRGLRCAHAKAINCHQLIAHLPQSMPWLLTVPMFDAQNSRQPSLMGYIYDHKRAHTHVSTHTHTRALTHRQVSVAGTLPS